MGCTSSKESAPGKPNSHSLPKKRSLSDTPRQGAVSNRPRDVNKRGLGDTARPKETFEAYASRGVIRQSALFPEETPSKRTENLANKKRVGGYEKYTRE